MDDTKVLEMLAQLLQGQTEMKQEIQGVKDDVQGVKDDVQGVKKIQLRMEATMIDKFGGLFDSRDVQDNAIKNMTEKLDRIEVKVEVLQLETAHIRRVK